MKTCKFIFLLLVVLLFSCSENKKEAVGKEEKTEKHSQKPSDPLKAYFYDKAKELGLKDLQTNKDSFEFRIWFNPELMVYGEVLVIKKRNNKWTCIDYRYRKKQIPGTNLTEIDSVHLEFKRPKSGWPLFFRKFKEVAFLPSISQEEIREFKPVVNDGLTFCFELANRNEYKCLVYNCPDYYAKKYKECAVAVNVLAFIHEELGFMFPGYTCFPENAEAAE